jgi:hypothetical protein
MADSTTKKSKNYVKGGAKEVTFSNGGSLINLDIKVEGKVIGSQGEILPNEAGYVKLVLSKLPAPDKFDNDFSIYENEYKPDPSKKKAAPAATLAKGPAKKTGASDDFPF